ncbi:MAG TPA: glycosyltransferase family 1 protein [Thermoanaerobaculales bacterium]|nr:glycosyltransferase family 1 protein [Thermoanaerobaculales bacterium]HQL30215.1 glycosyltransferase family 1 protein [Thermoanaerobaculales bacterium]
MRVALFTDTFDGINGVATTLHQLANWAGRLMLQLDIFAYARQGGPVEERGPVRIVRVRPRMPLRIYEDIDFDLAVPHRGLQKMGRGSSYDVVHCATPGSMGLNGLLVGRRTRAPLVGSYHTALPEFARVRAERLASRLRLPQSVAGAVTARVIRIHETWFYNRCRLVLAPSEAVCTDLQRRLATRVGMLGRGVDTDRFHPRFREAHDEVRVLYVGRLSIEKNLDLLAELLHERSDVRLMMVGDGPYRQRLEDRLPRATFTGFLAGDELSRAYASADVFVFPSPNDTFGIAVLEAMSSGVPVVVTDRMGPQELVKDGLTGFVAAGEREFRDRIDRLVADPGLRRTMGGRARQQALERSWSSVFEALVDHYRSVADPEPPAGKSLAPTGRRPWPVPAAAPASGRTPGSRDGFRR